MQQLSRLVVTFLLNSVWQVAVIWAVAGGCAWIAARVSASCQHSVWVAGLVLSVVVPVLGLARSSVSPAVQDRATLANAAVDSGHAPLTNGRVASGSATRNVTGAIPPLWAEILRPQERRIPLSAGTAILAAACYLLFLLSRLIRFWYAWKRAWETAGSSTSPAISLLLESAAERSRLAFGLSNIPILCSPTIDAPATLGVRQPLIILPEAFLDTADIAMLTPVIAHEMAHIKRRDFGLNLIYELLYLPISFHPAAALMKRRIAQTRELACDELVTERLLGPSEYARALVTVASRVTGAGRHSYTLGVFDADNLEERVMKLTDNKSRASVRVGRAILLSAAFVLLATAAIASAYSLNAGPATTASQLGVQQERIEREKTEREKSLAKVVTKDGAVYAYRVEIPAELKPLIGTWKGSADYRPDNSEVSRTNPVRNSEVKLVHSDVQIDFGVEEGKLTATYMTYEKITRASGEEAFEMHQSKLVNPQFDGETVTTVTEGQQMENAADQERTGQPGNRFFRIKVTGDGQAEAWNGIGAEEAPHIVLKRVFPNNEPSGRSKEERRNR